MKLEEEATGSHSTAVEAAPHEAAGGREEMNLSELRQALDAECPRNFNKSMDFARHNKPKRVMPGRIPSSSTATTDSDFYGSSFAGSSFMGESFLGDDSFANSSFAYNHSECGDGDDVLLRSPVKRMMSEHHAEQQRNVTDLETVLDLEDEEDGHGSSKDLSTDAEGEKTE